MSLKILKRLDKKTHRYYILVFYKGKKIIYYKCEPFYYYGTIEFSNVNSTNIPIINSLLDDIKIDKNVVMYKVNNFSKKESFKFQTGENIFFQILKRINKWNVHHINPHYLII